MSAAAFTVSNGWRAVVVLAASLAMAGCRERPQTPCEVAGTLVELCINHGRAAKDCAALFLPAVRGACDCPATGLER